MTLIPTVEVLRIQNPAVDTETGEQSDSSRIQVTLDLLPQDAAEPRLRAGEGSGLARPAAPGEDGTQPRASLVPLEILLGAKLG